MAKEKIAPGAKRGGTVSKVATWVIGGLLFLGLIGFGAGSFGSGGARLATVDGEIVQVSDFFREYDRVRRMRGPGGGALPPDQAQAIALTRVVTDAALAAEARDLGLSAGDARVVDALSRDPRFVGLLPGTMDRDAYDAFLRQERSTAADYEGRVRADLAADLVRRSVIGDLSAPAGYAALMTAYILEERDVSWALLGPEDLAAPIADPDPAELAEWFAENAEAFTIPEAKEIAYLWIGPDAIAATIEPDEAALQALFDARADELSRPERRLAERLVFPDAAAADAAAARIAAGESDFTAEVELAGQTRDAVDLGPVTRADLGDAADAVFGTGEIGVVGPVDTPDGPALFRVNAVLNAVETTLDDVRAELSTELALADASGVIDELVDPVEDLLVSGATIEEVAAEIEGAEAGTLFYSPGARDGLLAYSAIRLAADAITEDDFAESDRTADGGLFALRMDGIRPARVPELEEVGEAAVAAWRAERQSQALLARAEALGEVLDAGGTIPLDLRTATGATREGGMPGAPQPVIEAAFETAEGEVAALPVPGGAAILRVDAVRPAAADATSPVADALMSEAGAGFAADLFAAYAAALQREKDVTIDQRMLNAVRAELGTF
ncbi:MAG: peptidyl-prolyl cis-trans isomerase [Hasllibacter sp.]